MKRILLASSILIIAAVIFAGCGDDKTTNSNPPPQGGKRVTISDFQFSPLSMTISVGDTVIWTNQGPTAHTTTSNTGIWDSGLLGRNQTFTRIFTAAGSFPYHCTPHPQMTGTITVQ
jgi:plastocyanin